MSTTIFRNTQKMMERQVYPSDASRFLPLHARNLDCNNGVYIYFVNLLIVENKFHCLSSWKRKLMSPYKSK